MAAPNLREQDWEHRLHVLSAWQKWQHLSGSVGDDGATYRAVLDGCAVTIRAICYTLRVSCKFTRTTISNGPSRLAELLKCCKDEDGLVYALTPDRQKCLLEVLYLGNRAVAHPNDGGLDHAVGSYEMTVAINIVINWLVAKQHDWPELAKVPKEFLIPIS